MASGNSSFTITGTHQLTTTQFAAVSQLATLCNETEGLKLKLTEAAMLPGERSVLRMFLLYAGAHLAGFCGLDAGGREAEVCGMVHPDFRRRGIGTALLDEAMRECDKQQITSVLIICEQASTSGTAFVAAQPDLALDFAEDHMVLPASHPVAVAEERLQVDVAQAPDVPALAHITASAFGDPVDFTRQRIAQNIGNPNERYYLGSLGGEPVATVKAWLTGSAAGLYAFGVIPAMRGKGMGRELLTRVIDQLRREGHHEMSLEVDPDNTVARTLYESIGFRTFTTYGYYRFEIH